ncbi:MAG: putative 2-dehydropantoate 2-reductase [Paludibacteraceae bacterium]|nr:putative 2-dehydropantoate 2-reductase [Paludibacteraceae bacterium]
MRKLSYAVIGTGAIGGYYGGRLALSGQDVHFLYHSEYDYVKANGLDVKSVNGDFHLNNMQVYNNTESMPKCDVILVCMKSTQNDKLPQMLAPIVKDDSTIMLIQNGLGLEQELAKSFPNQVIAGGMAFICSSRVSPGHIIHADYGALTTAYLNNKYDEETAEQIKADFKNANVPYTQGDDLNMFRWRKLVWNIPYNGLTVVLRTTTDKLMQNPASRQLITDLMEETVAGARACGANIKDDFVQKMLSNTDNMEPYAPSMRLDYDNHRQMEIRAIYSNPVKMAKAAGVHMHKVEMLEQQLRFIQENEYNAK